MELYTREASSNALTSERNFDSWLRDTWLSHKNTGQKRRARRSKRRLHHDSNMDIYVYVEGDSSQPHILRVERRKRSLKQFKALLSDYIYCDDSWRYFFLNWCDEIKSEVKDELVQDHQIVPTYNSNVTVFIAI